LSPATCSRTASSSSPSRAHHLAHRRPFSGLAVLAGPFGWMLAAWIPAYAGTAVIFALYPVLFQQAFGVAPSSSSIAFAGIMFAWSFLSVASPGLTGQLVPDAEGDAQGLLNRARPGDLRRHHAAPATAVR
jgi:hypothetical protein